ncbi:OsmC family protein [Embleya sp. NPDC056575]|uniref:OsmC family protein n=1 Tax=unclassified Embleya TaxID=2699296 RepID=UPI0036CEA047
MIEATALPTPWQVGFRTDDNEGMADTLKGGIGGAAGMRPHELLEAALATCMAISARMALADLGVGDADVDVRVHLERGRTQTRFRYELVLDPALEAHREAVMERVERSPVRSTLSKRLVFDPA